jgi:hypothetical protein
VDADPQPSLDPVVKVPQRAIEASDPPQRAGDASPDATPDVPADPPAQTPHEDPAAIAAEREERSRTRLRQTARDMVLSMLVVLGAVLVLWLPFRHDSGGDAVATVDPASVIAGARAAEPWPVLAPIGLPTGWRCTSARISQAADGLDIVHLGYLSPTSTYVGLEQSATKVTGFVRESTLKGDEQGTVDVAGSTWTTYENADKTHRSLVRRDDPATYVVVGSGPYDQLEQFAGTLRAG